MPDIQIVKLDPAAADVIDLLAASDAFYQDLYPAESNHLEAADDLDKASVIFLGCRQDGQLLACGAAKLMQDDGYYAEIKRVYVSESSRGLGLSRRLMEQLESELRMRGVTRVRLETGIHQPEALGLYRKLGYGERGPFGSYGEDPLSVFMEKSLTSSAESPPLYYHLLSVGRGILGAMPHPAAVREMAQTFELLAERDINQVISLLGPDEAKALGLADEAETVRAAGMDFVSLPIVDMGLPSSVDEFGNLAHQLHQQLRVGKNSVVHCRGGIGRSGLLAATLLLFEGLGVDEAFARVSACRGHRVPETEQQGHWLQMHRQQLCALAGIANE